MQSAVVALLLFTKYVSSSDWDYDHMEVWGDAYSMCNAQDESPINIDTLSDDLIYDTCIPDFNWTLDYTKQTFKISNNGHSVGLTPVETIIDPEGEFGSIQADDGTHYITLTSNEDTIATFPNYFLPEDLDGDHHTFCLHSLHMHWGLTDDTGSEHRYDGEQFPLEIHFVHYSCNHATIGDTLAQYSTEKNIADAAETGWDTHELAVVGIFFDVVDENNPAFDTIFTDIHLEHARYPDDPDGAQTNEIVKDLDLSELIPSDLGTAGYFAYEGSLTTPPCTDIVRWFVMNARGYIGTEQIEKLRTFMGSNHSHNLAPNYREVQDNINPIYVCMDNGSDVVMPRFKNYTYDNGEDGGVTMDDTTAKTIIWVFFGFSILSPIFMGVFCCWKSKKERKIATDINSHKTQMIINKH